jgi:hypothetical protein
VAPLERISLSGSAQRIDLDLIINSSPGKVETRNYLMSNLRNERCFKDYKSIQELRWMAIKCILQAVGMKSGSDFLR